MLPTAARLSEDKDQTRGPAQLLELILHHIPAPRAWPRSLSSCDPAHSSDLLVPPQHRWELSRPTDTESVSTVGHRKHTFLSVRLPELVVRTQDTVQTPYEVCASQLFTLRGRPPRHSKPSAVRFQGARGYTQVSHHMGGGEGAHRTPVLFRGQVYIDTHAIIYLINV